MLQFSSVVTVVDVGTWLDFTSGSATVVTRNEETKLKKNEDMLKFMFSKKATEIDEIFTVDLTLNT